MRRNVFFLACLIIFSGNLIAQKRVIYSNNPKSQFRFSGTAALSQKLDIKNTGEPLLQSSNGFGYEFFVIFSQPIAAGFRINGGIGWSMIPFYYGYNFPVPEGSIFDNGITGDFTTNGLNLHYNQAMLTYPVSIQKCFPLEKYKPNNWQLSLEAGIRFNQKQSFPFTGHSGHFYEKVQYFDLRVQSTGSQWYPSYFFKAGLIRVNSRGNSYHVNVIYNYSPQAIAIGTYNFPNLGYDSYGTFEHHASFLGLEIAYALSFKKYNTKDLIKPGK